MAISEAVNGTVAKAAEAAAPEKKTRARKTAAKKDPVAESASKTCCASPMVYVQYGDAEYDVNAVVEAVKADFSQNCGDAVTEMRVYIKPEDGAAYYVVNGSAGKVAL